MGYDNVSVRTIKQHVKKISDILARGINTYFDQNSFPDELKVARITPIFKTGNRTDKSNYRPVSVLPILSKPLERVIEAQLKTFFKSNKIIHPNQFGFTEKSSTLSATLNLTEKVYNHIKARKQTSCLMLDLMKAFDCINFEILLHKLQKCGVIDGALALIKSYLTNRKQLVQIGDFKSDQLTLKSGIPQGSILGPLLFIIYMKDIFKLPLSDEIQLFADDAIIIYGENNWQELKKSMESDLIIINNYLNLNKMKLNMKKSTFIIFQPGTLTPDFDSIEFCGDQIQRVNEAVYLGLNIDYRLKWLQHIDHLKSKISPIIGVLRRVGKYLSSDIKMNIYHSHILSHLLYLLPIWGAACTTRMREVEILQKAAIKALFNLRRTQPSIDLFSPNLLPLHKLKEYEFMITIYKIENNMLKCENNFPSNYSVTGRNTRTAMDYRLPKYTLSATRNSVFYGGFAAYNRLPLSVRTLKLSEFKVKIKEMLFKEYFKDYYERHEKTKPDGSIVSINNN